MNERCGLRVYLTMRVYYKFRNAPLLPALNSDSLKTEH